MPSRDFDLRELREEYAAGRLTLDEFTDRVGTALSADARVPAHLDRFDEHLIPGEKVLWVGRPDPAKHLTSSDRLIIPFSILWGGFAIFWVSLAAAGAGLFALWGIPFVAVGLYLIVGRFFYKARLKRRTWFAVTNKRVLKLERKRRGDSIDALFLDAIPAVGRDVDAVGSGCVIFGSSNRWLADMANSGMPSFFASNVEVPLAFYDIHDAAHVAELVAQLRQRRPDG
jgi:hypothetical protein